MGSEYTDENEIPKDGLSGSPDPVPREPGAAPKTGTENDSPPDAANNSAAREDVEGVNKAVGPAEDADDETGDDRALTTDASPTD